MGGYVRSFVDHYGQDKAVCLALIDANKCKLELQVLVPLVRDNNLGCLFKSCGGKFLTSIVSSSHKC